MINGSTKEKLADLAEISLNDVLQFGRPDAPIASTAFFDVAGEGFKMTLERGNPGDDAIPTKKHELPTDVRRLVIAARRYTDGGIDLTSTEQGSEGRELLEALELFSSRVPYEDEPDPDFDMVQEGDMVRMVALDTWTRNNESTFLRLQLEATNAVSETDIAGWTDDQCKQADCWACSVMLSASDNDDVIVPPRPSFIAVKDGPENFRSDFARWKDQAGDCHHVATIERAGGNALD